MFPGKKEKLKELCVERFSDLDYLSTEEIINLEMRRTLDWFAVYSWIKQHAGTKIADFHIDKSCACASAFPYLSTIGFVWVLIRFICNSLEIDNTFSFEMLDSVMFNLTPRQDSNRDLISVRSLCISRDNNIIPQYIQLIKELDPTAHPYNEVFPFEGIYPYRLLLDFWKP
ncbi:MAG: hypothetical protein WAK03_11555 [Methylocystis sp.]